MLPWLCHGSRKKYGAVTVMYRSAEGSIIRGFDNPISSIRVSRVRVTLTVTVRVSRVSVMVSVRDSVK